MLEGLSHGTTSKGKIARLAQDGDGRWTSETFLDLGHAPETSARDVDGSLFVATTHQLLRIVPASKTKVVLVDHVFWSGLGPNSMVIARSGTIFMGMCHGVAKVEKKKTSYKVSWLLPNKEFAEQKHDNRFK